MKVPEKVSPLAKRTRPVGSHTTQEPRTGIIEKIIATKVKTRAFGTHKKNKPAPTAKPWMSPIKT